MTHPKITTTSVADDTGRWSYARGKALRHIHWARTQGLKRLIEEDQLDPVARVTSAARRWRWRRSHAVSTGSAIPVFLVGVQRSGTNMLVRGLESAPEFEVYNENNRHAFARFRLLPDAQIHELTAASRHRYVLFKPLCDSHRVNELLDVVPAGSPGRAIWAFRDVDGRARSAIAKFGDANLQALRAIAAGGSKQLWQAQGLSARSLRILRSFDYSGMTAETAAALFWYVRNTLFFEQGLSARRDVLLSSYDALVADPEASTRALCAFLGFPWRPEVAEHVERREPGGASRRRIPIDPRVRDLCDGLGERLDSTAAAQRVYWLKAAHAAT